MHNHQKPNSQNKMETIITNNKPLYSITFCLLLALAATPLFSLGAAAAATADDEKDCAEQMTDLATCIPFVSGTAKKPTQECCDDTKKVRTAKPKCLCLLIKASSDPSIGLPINTTLALEMPAACNIDAKVSDCPFLLDLPADSPDAKIFKVAGSGDSSTGSASDSPTKSASTPTAAATNSDSTKATTSTVSTSGSEAKAAATGSVFLITGLAGASFALFI